MEKTLNSNVMRQIAARLKTVLGDGNATLYDLLGCSITDDPGLIREKAIDEYRRSNPGCTKGLRDDSSVTAKLRVLENAIIIFKDEDSKRGYDIALSRRPTT